MMIKKGFWGRGLLALGSWGGPPFLHRVVCWGLHCIWYDALPDCSIKFEIVEFSDVH